MGLVTEMAQKRLLVSKYETHRGFKALAFYILTRSLTTSNGIYLDPNKESDSAFRKRVGKTLGISFNTVAQYAKYASEFNLIQITPTGYKFIAVDKIIAHYGIYLPKGEITYHTINLKQNQSLEHILKTLVFGENFAKQQYAVMRKIKQIPGVIEKMHRYIPNWQELPVKELLKQVVMWQKHTFINYVKGTEAYDLFHSIHADITLTCRRIRDHFNFKSWQSSMYIKQVLEKLQYITIQKRELTSTTATRLPHEPDGKPKPLKFVWLPIQKNRKWILPDLITITI